MQILQPILVFWEQYNSESSFISVCVSDLHFTYHNYTSTVIIILCIPFFPKLSKFTSETYAKVDYLEVIYVLYICQFTCPSVELT